MIALVGAAFGMGMMIAGVLGANIAGVVVGALSVAWWWPSPLPMYWLAFRHLGLRPEWIRGAGRILYEWLIGEDE